MSQDSFKISGRKFALPAAEGSWKFEQRPGGWMIATRDGVRVRFLAHERQGKLSASILDPSSGGRTLHGEIQAQARGGSAQGGSDADLISQFPGKIRKILVKAGDDVKEGDSLLLMEAMKMEFAIRAPFAGRVKAIRVQEGQQIGPGDRFVDMEEAADGE